MSLRWTLLFLLAVALPIECQPSLQEEKNGETMRREDMHRSLAQISVARNSRFAQWAPSLDGFTSEASRIFDEQAQMRDHCLVESRWNSGPCWSASIRESSVLGNMWAICGLSNDQQKQNYTLEKTKPQVLAWTSSGYAKKKGELMQNATDYNILSEEVNRAKFYADKSLRAITDGDWVLALITQRQSEMLLDDAFVRSVRQSYSKQDSR